LDTVEVLEVDQWLALLIIGDLDPFTPAPRSPACCYPHRKSDEPPSRDRHVRSYTDQHVRQYADTTR